MLVLCIPLHSSGAEVWPSVVIAVAINHLGRALETWYLYVQSLELVVVAGLSESRVGYLAGCALCTNGVMCHTTLHERRNLRTART